MKTLRFVPVAAVLWLLAPATANADVRLGLGADYWATPRVGFVTLTFAVDGYIAPHLQIGGRLGGLLTGSPYTVGVPLDLLLRASLAGEHIYFEGLLGPWLFLQPYGLGMRFHGAFGFGVQSGGLLFGFEVGWLDPSPHAGLRLGFQI
jgi:hypothetical protein